MLSFKSLFSIIFIASAISVQAETHTVHFINNCGFGTPTLIQGQNVLSTGQDFTSNGPLIMAFAYLQTGNCGFDGEGCMVVEITLINPTSPGGGSAADITLIPPRAFSVPTGFEYSNGCVGLGADCANANCTTALHNVASPAGEVVITCESDNVNLVIEFCGGDISQPV